MKELNELQEIDIFVNKWGQVLHCYIFQIVPNLCQKILKNLNKLFVIK